MEISITLIIVIITSIVSLMAINNNNLLNQLTLYPPAVRRGQWYRFLSSGLVHKDYAHLIFNMLVLYMFGEGRVTAPDGQVFFQGVEFQFQAIFGQMGKLLYLAMYIIAIIVSDIPTYVKNKDNYYFQSLGASGAVSAVIFAGIIFHPLSGIGLFFIPIYIAGFLFGIIYLLFSSWLDRKGGDNINHSAHIFGALFGVGFTIIACQAFSDYPLLEMFVEQIKGMSLGDIIQTQ